MRKNWKIWQAENLAENLENLTCWRTGGKSGKLDAENLRKNPLTGKSAENLENLKM